MTIMSKTIEPADDTIAISELRSFVEGALAVRRWERNFVPFSSPQIALDIALYATASRLQNRFIVSKSVHLTVGHSVDRVREVVMELVSGGWLAKVPHPIDRRIRLLEATDKLVQLMSEYEKCSRTRHNQPPCSSPSTMPEQPMHIHTG